MAIFYSQDLIDQVRGASDIVDIISEYVPLKKKGANYFGLCPFHAEKTPSFSVNQAKQIYHCFGCGEGGNVFTFLMNHDKLGFTEALKLLARKSGIKLPKPQQDKKTADLNDQLYYANSVANAYFKQTLNQKNLSEKAKTFLKQRGVDSTAEEKFSLGYAPDKWDGFLSFAQSKGLDPKILVTAGLIVPKSDGKGYVDRFRDRLMFPIFNISGKIVGFGGRTLNPKEEAKYMNSPETPIYQKGKILYGLSFSKDSIREEGKAIIVEGYMDFISLFQAGIKNLVATSGTAFTTDQARLLSRHAQEVFLLFDSDSAGQQAAVRSLDILFDQGFEVKIVSFPQGEDPDSYVKKSGSEKLTELIEKAQNWIEFRTNRLGKKFSTFTIVEQEKIIADFMETASKIKNEVRRELFLKKLSESLEMNENILRKNLNRKIAPAKSQNKTGGTLPLRRTTETLEKEFLRILLEGEYLIEKVQGKLSVEDFVTSEHREILRLLFQSHKEHQPLSVSSMLDKIKDGKIRNLITEISVLEIGAGDLELQLTGYINSIRKQQKEKQIQDITDKIRDAEAKQDTETAKKLSENLHKLLIGS
ncbi:MAG: hypothetical protein RBG1_1C00001G1481 [candidate division Zixibacteria bacterium RBG-1]|nr:MAG: hypothetical protein RBG1_1C00001G1481 [candidate division Zixibacteria bacterium RBG-1]OGC85769.1 MAG: DNA primase [candidate division Zixibacteria bacterium RBG_19FT_COMBO_42_43]